MAKNAMVWGASGGIGRALVAALLDDGWQVAALSRHGEGLEKATLYVEADPGDDFSAQQAVMGVARELDEINLWIYSAGDITGSKVDEMEVETWQRILNANLTGAYIATHHSLPLLAADAHLFYLGAYSEKLQLPGLAAYAAAKAGLEAFGTALGKEQRKRKVTVVRPPAVDTPLWEKMPLRLPKDALEPQTVAEKILSAYADGTKGQLDL